MSPTKRGVTVAPKYHQSMDEDRQMTLRLPPDLHAAAVAHAKQRNQSLNRFIADAVRRLVHEADPVSVAGDGSSELFEVVIRFELEPGGSARARDLVEQATGLFRVAGAPPVTTRLVRTIPVD